jgi:hypothetical protein
MSEFRFEVTVSVSDWPAIVPVYRGEEYARTARDYAKAALFSASLRAAVNLDGFADLDGPDARITDVDAL